MARSASTTLVDGHNAIHRLRIRGASHEAVRRDLLLRVREIDPRAIVYFDARHAPPGLPPKGSEEGMRVVYVRRVEADRAILDDVRKSDHPASRTVVTDDRELAGGARQLGARTRSVDDFFADLGVRPEPPEKTPPKGSFRPEDFGLPKRVNLDHPPQDMRDQ